MHACTVISSLLVLLMFEGIAVIYKTLKRIWKYSQALRKLLQLWKQLRSLQNLVLNQLFDVAFLICQFNHRPGVDFLPIQLLTVVLSTCFKIYLKFSHLISTQDALVGTAVIMMRI